MASSRATWSVEPKHVTRALAPLRRGRAGEQREAVRRMLLRLMGFDAYDMEHGLPRDRKVLHFGQHDLAPDDRRELAIVAHDALRELGYDGAADELAGRGLLSYTKNIPVLARRALEILEAGPPSMYLGDGRILYLVFKRPLYRMPSGPRESDPEILIARSAEDPTRPWRRFVVGVRVFDDRGRLVGWDPEGGHTWQTRHRTLAEAKAYGRRP